MKGKKKPIKFELLLLLIIVAQVVIVLLLGSLIRAERNGLAEQKKRKAERVAETETEAVSESETETETHTTEPETFATKYEEMGLPRPPQLDVNSWELVLVNNTHTVDENFAPETGYASSQTSSTEQDVRIIDALNAFAAAAEAEGLPVYLSSGYRSYWDQNYLFDLQCQMYDEATAATIVARPGTSEHQTGLCCDITDYYREYKNDELESTETYQWMSKHCAEYGFIVRFPKGKEDITEIIYEPWHYRYVGKEAAAYIMDNDLTLEEFLELYEDLDDMEPAKAEGTPATVAPIPGDIDSVAETEAGEEDADVMVSPADAPDNAEAV